jgi:hypothetical protein
MMPGAKDAKGVEGASGKPTFRIRRTDMLSKAGLFVRKVL